MPAAEARRYERIVPQGGRYTSTVLGLDLAIQEGALRFFQGMAELFGSDDLIRRLTGMVESLETKADKAEALAAGALAGLRAGVIGALEARHLSPTEEIRERVAACEDPAILEKWLIRAITAPSAAEALTD